MIGGKSGDWWCGQTGPTDEVAARDSVDTRLHVRSAQAREREQK